LTAVEVRKLLGTLSPQLPAKKRKKKYLHPTQEPIHMEIGHFTGPKGSFNKKEMKAFYYLLKTLKV